MSRTKSMFIDSVFIFMTFNSHEILTVWSSSSTVKTVDRQICPVFPKGVMVPGGRLASWNFEILRAIIGTRCDIGQVWMSTWGLGWRLVRRLLSQTRPRWYMVYNRLWFVVSLHALRALLIIWRVLWCKSDFVCMWFHCLLNKNTRNGPVYGLAGELK